MVGVQCHTLTTLGKIWCPVHRKLGGPFWTVWKISPPPRYKPQTVWWPIASLYTDYNILAHPQTILALVKFTEHEYWRGLHYIQIYTYRVKFWFYILAFCVFCDYALFVQCCPWARWSPQRRKLVFYCLYIHGCVCGERKVTDKLSTVWLPVKKCKMLHNVCPEMSHFSRHITVKSCKVSNYLTMHAT